MHSPALAVGFVVLTAAGSVNVLTDSIFIAADKAVYTTWTDGLSEAATILLVLAVSWGWCLRRVLRVYRWIPLRPPSLA